MPPGELARDVVLDQAKKALAEDLGSIGDQTCSAVIPEDLVTRARIVAKQAGVLCGLELAIECFKQMDPECRIHESLADGASFEASAILLDIEAKARALLSAERSALNFLQQLSGIATLTRAFVRAVEETDAIVLETRKTHAGLRVLEKYAVSVGGGQQQRFALFDAIMIKENHFVLSGNGVAAEGIRRTVMQAASHPGRQGRLFVEARTLPEAIAAFQGGADVLMLDNIGGEDLARCVKELRSQAAQASRSLSIEATGRITLDNVAMIASSGVDRISVGALTHSAKALDLSMLVEGVQDPLCS